MVAFKHVKSVTGNEVTLFGSPQRRRRCLNPRTLITIMGRHDKMKNVLGKTLMQFIIVCPTNKIVSCGEVPKEPWASEISALPWSEELNKILNSTQNCKIK